MKTHYYILILTFQYQQLPQTVNIRHKLKHNRFFEGDTSKLNLFQVKL